MIPARRRALLAGMLLLLAAGIAAAILTHRREGVPAGNRPTLLLLTSLPLVFGEHFSVQQNGSSTLKALESRFRVLPISTTAPSELAKGKLLLMAQPLGQAPEDLVALDDWVRRGGRVMLLADPLLEWPSERPLGDPLRPPPTFVDTGLLGHWGLRLDAPDRRGHKQLELGGMRVLTSSPGSLWGTCRIGPDRLVARCKLGRGTAVVVADADLLDASDLGPAATHNVDALVAELSAISGLRVDL